MARHRLRQSDEQALQFDMEPDSPWGATRWRAPLSTCSGRKLAQHPSRSHPDPKKARSGSPDEVNLRSLLRSLDAVLAGKEIPDACRDDVVTLLRREIVRASPQPRSPPSASTSTSTSSLLSGLSSSAVSHTMLTKPSFGT